MVEESAANAAQGKDAGIDVEVSAIRLEVPTSQQGAPHNEGDNTT